MAETTKIMFKRGVQSSLPQKAQDGVFYLTTDTNRLYVGQGSDKAPVLLNQTVQIVPAVSNLPTNPMRNDFYYCIKENILAVYTGNPADGYDAKNWTQINPDTNTNNDTYVTSVDQINVAAGTEEQDKDKLFIKFNINQTSHDLINSGNQGIAPIEVKIPISKDVLNTINPIGVGLENKAIKDAQGQTVGAVIKTVGAGANAANQAKLVEGDNISIDVNASKEIEISAKDTTYTLSATGNKLNFTDSNSEVKSIALKGITKPISISTSTDASGAEEIDVSHKKYICNDVELTEGQTTSGKSYSAGGAFNVIDSMTLEYGHIVTYNVHTVTLPEDKDTTNATASIGVDSSAPGRLVFSITDTGSKTVSAMSGGDTKEDNTDDQVLYYKVNGAKVYNQGNIDFYTKNQIDTKLNTIDAMHYCGTLGSGTGATITSLPQKNVKNGDTYKVITAGTYGTQYADVGDLFIAQGTETSGVIAENRVVWTYIPSGDDTDTQYTLSASNNEIVLTSKVNANDKTSVPFAAGTALKVETESGTNGSPNKIKYSHDNVTCTSVGPNLTATALSRQGEFNVLDSITVNAQGHVTGYKTTKYALPEDKDTTYTLTLGNGSTNNSLAIELNGSDSSDQSVNLVGDDYVNISYDSGKGKFTHKQYQGNAKSTTTGTLSYGGTFEVMTGVTRDSGGHLTGYNTKVFTMPAAPESFTLSGHGLAVSNNAATITTTLTGTKSSTSSATLKLQTDTSSNIQFTNSSTDSANILTMSLVWGTF